MAGVTVGLRSYTPRKPSGNGGAIFVFFPDQKAPIGKNDNSKLAQIARKVFGKNKKYPVGHGGVIIFDEEGNTSYADFGRFGNKSERGEGNGIARVEGEGGPFNTANATFDEDGTISNTIEVINSLGDEGYFEEHNYGKVEYSVMQGLDYDAMSNYVRGVGVMEFGFGHGRNYCMQFATNTAKAGGIVLTPRDMEEITKQANAIIEEQGHLKGVIEAMKYLKANSPTGQNLINDMRDSEFFRGAGTMRRISGSSP